MTNGTSAALIGQRLSGRSAIFLLFAVVGLGGCGAEPSKQTIVAGDGFEITFSEYEQLLKLAPGVTKEQIKPARKAILDALIDQKLLAEASADQGLDDSPQVFQEVEASRRAILANAYIRELTKNAPQFSAGQIEQCYRSQPYAFADRARYTIREINVGHIAPSLLSQYAEVLDASGLDAAVAKVAADGGTGQPQQVQRYSGELFGPNKVRASEVRVGSNVLYRNLDGAHLGVIEEVEQAPISLSEATSDIREALAAQWRARTVEVEIKKLRDARKVKIVKPQLIEGNNR